MRVFKLSVFIFGFSASLFSAPPMGMMPTPMPSPSPSRSSGKTPQEKAAIDKVIESYEYRLRCLANEDLEPDGRPCSINDSAAYDDLRNVWLANHAESCARASGVWFQGKCWNESHLANLCYRQGDYTGKKSSVTWSGGAICFYCSYQGMSCSQITQYNSCMAAQLPCSGSDDRYIWTESLGFPIFCQSAGVPSMEYVRSYECKERIYRCRYYFWTDPPGPTPSICSLYITDQSGKPRPEMIEGVSREACDSYAKQLGYGASP